MTKKQAEKEHARLRKEFYANNKECARIAAESKKLAEEYFGVRAGDEFPKTLWSAALQSFVK